MKGYKNHLLLKILILIIIILVGIIIYSLVIKPQITGYAISAYNQGYESAIIQLVQQLVTCQSVPLRIGNESINVIAVECLQVAATE